MLCDGMLAPRHAKQRATRACGHGLPRAFRVIAGPGPAAAIASLRKLKRSQNSGSLGAAVRGRRRHLRNTDALLEHGGTVAL